MVLMDLCDPLDQFVHYHLSYRLGQLVLCDLLDQSARCHQSYQ